MRRVGPSIEELRGPGDQGKLVDEIEPPIYGALLRATYTEALNAAEISGLPFPPVKRKSPTDTAVRLSA